MSEERTPYLAHTNKEPLELERLSLENQKLRAELEQMRPNVWDGLQRLSPLLGGALAVAAFLFGVFQYVDQQQRELATRENELARQAAARDQEFMKPLWERELATIFKRPRPSQRSPDLPTARRAAPRSSSSGGCIKGLWSFSKRRGCLAPWWHSATAWTERRPVLSRNYRIAGWRFPPPFSRRFKSTQIFGCPSFRRTSFSTSRRNDAWRGVHAV